MKRTNDVGPGASNRFDGVSRADRQILTDFRRRCRIEELCVLSALTRAQQDCDERTRLLWLQRADGDSPPDILVRQADAARRQVEVLERELVRIRASLLATEDQWNLEATPADRLLEQLDRPGRLA